MGQVDDVDDGKFWIEFDDFIHVFRVIYICKLFNESFPTSSVSDEWSIASDTAGGCQGDNIRRNPQYQVRLCGGDECDVTVRLSVIETESMLRDGFPAIGIYLIKKRARATSDIYMNDIADKTAFQYARDIILEFKLSAKSPLLIIPCTFKKGKELRFNLTVYNTSSSDKIELKRL